MVKGRTKPPGKKPITDAVKLKIIEKTVKERPAYATHWSVRMMAEEIGIIHTSVQRIWNAHGLKPHLVRAFQGSPVFCEGVSPKKSLVKIGEPSHTRSFASPLPVDPISTAMTHPLRSTGITSLQRYYEAVRP